MMGGVMAGASQFISAGFRIAAQFGVKTGKNGGIFIGETLKVLSPNHKLFFEAGGTLIKIGSKSKNVRLDVGAKSLLHMNVEIGRNIHLPVGVIGAGMYGGLHQ